MTMKIESKHFLLMGKIVSTILIMIMILSWSFFLIVLLPMIMFVLYHAAKNNGKKGLGGFQFTIAMIPLAVMAFLIFRLWDKKIPEQITRTMRRPIPEMKKVITKGYPFRGDKI